MHCHRVDRRCREWTPWTGWFSSPWDPRPGQPVWRTQLGLRRGACLGLVEQLQRCRSSSRDRGAAMLTGGVWGKAAARLLPHEVQQQGSKRQVQRSLLRSRPMPGMPRQLGLQLSLAEPLPLPLRLHRHSCHKHRPVFRKNQVGWTAPLVRALRAERLGARHPRH